ncbi:MAG: BatA domain-containing protein [Janthinobacterium lividum]
MHLVHPWFLLGVGSVIIPIIVHLLQLRRPQRVLFTNIGFIREVDLTTTRQRKLQHLLLLFSRILFLAFLVLAFCQPFIPAGKQEQSRVAGAVSVLIDTSPSMRRTTRGEDALFSTSIKQAEALSKVYPTSQFRLINNGITAVSQVLFKAKLAALQPSSKSNLLSRIKISGINNGNNDPLYLFSDFQHSSFDPGFVKGFGSARQLVLVPAAADRTGNIFVDSVWFEEAFLRERTNLGLHVRLKNGGSEVVANCPVRVFLGSQQAATFQVTVSGGQTVVSVVQVQLPNQDLVRGRVVTGDAPVVFDNNYYFTARAAKNIRVLEIGNVPVAQSVYRNEPLFDYAFARPEHINYEALRRANLVLAQEVPTVSSELRDALRAVVARGGSVVIVPTGSMTGRSSYQQLFRDLGLGAVEWESVGTPPELREVVVPSPQEPFFRDVLGAPTRAVAMPRVAPVLRWSRTGADILRLRDGESYLSEFGSGIGKVYVFSAPFAAMYSDFTGHALFVPVLYKLAMRSFRDEQQLAYRLTQTAINLTVPAVAMGPGQGVDQTPFRLVRDSATWLPVQRTQGNTLRLEIPASLEAPGFYQVQRAGQAVATVAFNMSPKESELADYSAEQLRAMVGPNQRNIRVLDGGTDEAVIAQLQTERGGQPLWRYFLGLALSCLLAEALLIRFGKPKVGAPRATVVA